MMVDIRLPNINADTPAGKIAQMQNYMYQLVEQLNWALSTVDSAQNGNTENIVLEKQSKPLSQEEAVSTFNAIKALIIKSADIVYAYEDQMKKDFDGVYVAESDFGEFAQRTNQSLEEDSTKIQQNFTNIQTLTGSVNTILETQAYIKSGLLDYDAQGNAIYGVEVGQTDDGTFNKYARFTAGGIYFFLPGSSEAVAWMTGNKLFILNAEITGNLKVGNYVFDTSNGLAIKWVGD